MLDSAPILFSTINKEKVVEIKVVLFQIFKYMRVYCIIEVSAPNDYSSEEHYHVKMLLDVREEQKWFYFKY